MTRRNVRVLFVTPLPSKTTDGSNLVVHMNKIFNHAHKLGDVLYAEVKDGIIKHINGVDIYADEQHCFKVLDG